MNPEACPEGMHPFQQRFLGELWVFSRRVFALNFTHSVVQGHVPGLISFRVDVTECLTKTLKGDKGWVGLLSGRWSL